MKPGRIPGDRDHLSGIFSPGTSHINSYSVQKSNHNSSKVTMPCQALRFCCSSGLSNSAERSTLICSTNSRNGTYCL
jgi:hypothetical protein